LRNYPALIGFSIGHFWCVIEKHPVPIANRQSKILEIEREPFDRLEGGDDDKLQIPNSHQAIRTHRGSDIDQQSLCADAPG
jgi:hypothetical protein